MNQRRVFLLAAATAAVAAVFGARLPPTVEVVVLAAAVLLLGVPHGALDALHARDEQRLSRLRDWVAFVTAYVALALAVVCVWTAAPSASLVALLGFSAFHFSGDLESNSPLPLRVVHGLAPICLPALLHRKELGELFAALSPTETALDLAAGLEVLSVPLLVSATLFAAVYARRHAAATLEVVATAAMCAVAPPLLGFLVYFCLLHSWRHVDRTRRLYRPARTALLWSAVLPTVATAGLAAVAWAALDPTSLRAGVLQIVFVGLAALTVPHMLLIERIRLRGWRPRGVSEGALSGSVERRSLSGAIRKVSRRDSGVTRPLRPCR